MGKKISHKCSRKIEKKQPPQQQQQQQGLNTLIKVLKPRVYITNSSTFKSLVQELTGNGNISSGTPSFPPPLPVIDLDDGGYQESSADLSSFDSSQVNNFISPTTTTFDYLPFQESTSPEFSFDSSQVNSSINVPTSFGDYSPVQIGNSGFSFEYSSSEVNVATPFANFEYSRPLESCLGNDMSNMETGFSQYKEIESWLLEVDPTVYSYDDCYVTSNIEQEVSVSDYDLSGSHMIIF